MEHSIPNTTKPSLSLFHHLPFSFFTLLLLFLLSYNASTVFFFHLPFFSSPHHYTNPLPLPLPLPLSTPTHHSTSNLSSSVFISSKKLTLPLFNYTLLPILHNSHFHNRHRRVKRHKRGLRSVHSESPPLHFSLFQTKVKAFFSANSSCKGRFFMTWISPFKLFGVRELLSIESLFKSHPHACLVIVSKSLDSDQGINILTPFVKKGFKVMAIAPDFNYIFKDTHAEAWFNRLKRGNVNPGEVSLGQNLSNLLRLALLYKFGGTYIDADVVVLKSFSKLRNTIGAQNFDVKTKKWSRLNNAVLIFDKKHPLLFKFIEEFALTFDGNKWGHNGPYLISRVVSRVSVREVLNLTVLPPSAFYPVDWRGIRSLFRRPRDEVHSRWLVKKMDQIRKESFAMHLWNRHSRKLKVVKGSIVDSIVSSCCIFCNNY
ncbi:putative glycosyltransferase, DXD sugar-binding, alpha 1,4-glycosyltransferase [Lupinus albus]|uniref:Putative glycosyltransferase, DXD sugar-binding, alpha 1,4-glycosyltransferase n=1 Tax=Lupinus albus TaxID=3870 RepID=A0A6A4P0R3_LUPAL|nr:putative glycosyltransferase, DXD sugar-binding, alpha 1,4-glycosyltransferase [Lupinus albus]